MEVAGRDDRQAGLGDPGEERRAVEELEAVEERRPPLGIGCERRGPPSRESGVVERVRVGGDERRPLRACCAQRLLETCAHADEVAQAERDGVAGGLRLWRLVRQLEPGQHEQVVEPPCPLCLGIDLLEVGAEIRRLDVAVQQGVIRDRQHVEAVAPVEVADVPHAEGAVTPRRVRVQLAEQWVLLRCHTHRVPARGLQPSGRRHLHTGL